MLGLGAGEMVAIGVLVLVLFGGRKLPQLGSGLAKGIKNFQRGLKDQSDDPLALEQDKEQKNPEE